jgi:hypothetical protein
MAIQENLEPSTGKVRALPTLGLAQFAPRREFTPRREVHAYIGVSFFLHRHEFSPT